MEEIYVNYGRMKDIYFEFLKHPPADLRKSLFFDFVIQLKYMHGNGTLIIKSVKFQNFINENNIYKNGIRYNLIIRHHNGREEQRYLYLTLVEANTRSVVKYEGSDDSPRLQRVLLTHESICSRCMTRKSCGNKSETPSDPRILCDRPGALQIHLRCNQNCLKVAGNPRDNRRFALALSFEDITYNVDKIIGLSEKIFVHNNSKHSKNKKRKIEEIKSEPEPYKFEPVHIHPKIGIVGQDFCFNSRQWSKPGVSFKTSGIEMPISSLMLNAGITVRIPSSLYPGHIHVTLFDNGTPVFTFRYQIANILHLDNVKASTGMLVLTGMNQKNDHIFTGSQDCVIESVVEESEFPGHYARFQNPPQSLDFNFQSHAFNSSFVPDMQTNYHPTYFYGSSSSSSPNESYSSGESNSTPLMPTGPQYHHDPLYQ